MVSKKLIGLNLLMIFLILSILCTSQTVIAADAYYKCSDGKYFSLTFKGDGGADLVFSGSNKIEKLRFEGARTHSNENFSFHMGGRSSSDLSYIRKGKVIKIVDCDDIDKSSYPHGKGAAEAPQAGDTSPCQGVTQTKGVDIKNKAELERAITKQLIAKIPGLKGKSTITVRRVFACENWSIIEVRFPPNVAEDISLIYDKNPLTSHYVNWHGRTLAEKEDEPYIRDGILKIAPGIPPKLASCFAKFVMYSVGPEWGKQYKELFK
jgi:hypothetical protein